jgi:hypothetical protein
MIATLGCGPAVMDGDETSTTGEASASASASDDAGSSSITASGAASGEAGSTTDPPATDSTSSTSGASEDTTTESGSDTGDPPPTGAPARMLIFYTPQGYFAEDAWSGSGTDLTLGSMLAPLEPWQDELLVVHGISNFSSDPEGVPVLDAHSTSAAGLLTGGLLGAGSGGDESFDPHFAGGPSLDVRLGELLPPAPHASVHLAVRTTSPTVPLGVSYLGLDAPNEPYTAPALAFQALFGAVPGDPRLDELEAQIDAIGSSTLAVLDAQLAIARVAFALDVTRSALVSVDLTIPQIVWSELGLSQTFHEAVVLGKGDAGAVIDAWGSSFGAFVDDLATTPAPEGGMLLDSTLLMWISDFGPTPAAHTRTAVLCVIIDASGGFATGRIIEVEHDQADLAATIAAVMGVDLGAFGDPALGPNLIEPLLAR